MLPNFELMFAMRMFARSRRFPRRAVQMGDDLENSFLCVELFLACAMGFADGQMRWSAFMLAYEVVGGLLNAVAPECARSADPFDEAGPCRMPNLLMEVCLVLPKGESVPLRRRR